MRRKPGTGDERKPVNPLGMAGRNSGGNPAAQRRTSQRGAFYAHQVEELQNMIDIEFDLVITFGLGRVSVTQQIDCENAMSGLGMRRDIVTKGFDMRSEEHTSELQSIMRISYAV